MLVMGTLIGGGVLALPIVGIGSGFIPILCLVLFLWALMIVTGFLFLEVTLSFPTGENSFTSMAYKTLGRGGKIITFISYLLLLYALVAATLPAEDLYSRNYFFSQTFTFLHHIAA